MSKNLVSMPKQHGKSTYALSRLQAENTELRKQVAKLEKTNEVLRTAAVRGRLFTVCLLAFFARDRGTERERKMLNDIQDEAVRHDQLCRDALDFNANWEKRDER